MQAEIDRAVAPLVGLPLWGPARESNLLTLRLGGRPGAAAEGGGYVLFVYCAWRLARGAALLAGSADLFTPADPDEELDTFDYEEPGSTWWDARWRAYVEGAAAPPTVTAAAGDALGGLRLTLSDGAVLEVFPNSAPAEHVETEFWGLRPAGGGGGGGGIAVGTDGVAAPDAADA